MRKRLSYRDQGGKDLAEHRDHWRTFEWQSGPWLCKSKNLRWGQPQVWAATAEEGKRVLSHAAAIAGVDLSNPAHRWECRLVSGARDNPELPMVLEHTSDGMPWVSERGDSAGYPSAAP